VVTVDRTIRPAVQRILDGMTSPAIVRNSRVDYLAANPLGRALYARQREGGPIETIRPGDRVFFEPGENHWHGATPNRFMVHIANQQTDESGSPVTWGTHVADEQYAAAATHT
jgi:hypothetical protein